MSVRRTKGSGAHAHDFVRSESNGVCALCRNLWSSKDMITSKFQTCSSCGVTVHTNCRSIAQTCIECNEDCEQHLDVDSSNVTGWFHMKVIHAYDINVAAGTALYAQVRLKHNAQSLRSLTADSGQNDCLWEANHDVDTQLTALKFHIQQTLPKSEDIWQELKVEVEVWSTFLGFFDTCLATTEIDVTPVFLFPGCNVERWFSLHNKVSAEGELAEGKLLVNMLFESLAPVAPPPAQPRRAAPVAPASPVLTPLKAKEATHVPFTEPHGAAKSPSTPETVPSKNKTSPGAKDVIERANACANGTSPSTVKVDPATREAALSRIAEIAAAATGDRPPCASKAAAKSEEKKQESGTTHEANKASTVPTDAKKEPVRSQAAEKKQGTTAAPAQVHVVVTHTKIRQDHVEVRSRSGTNTSIDGATSSSSTVVPAVRTSLDPHKLGMHVPTASSAIAAGVKEDSAPVQSAASVDFYQSIADFTERTTNTIGNFFYEIEALNLTSSTRDAIDGDWNDSHKAIAAPLKPGEVVSSKPPADAVTSAPEFGVGYMHIHVVSAFKAKVKDVADGDHYILACVEDTKREFKSKSVYGSATPIFNVRWTIKMEHFRAAVNLFLMDAHTHRRIATARLSCYALMQRDVDRNIKSWKDAPTERVVLRGVSDGEEMGYLTAAASFEEDIDGLFLTEPLHDAPLSPPEAFSVQRLSAHIARFTAIIDLINLWYAEFLYITEWQDPMTTFVVFLVFLYCTLKVQAEYALSGVVFALVVLMTRSWWRRRSGQYVKHYVEVGVKAMPKLEYKPIARMRISVLGFRNTDIREQKAPGEAPQGHVNFNRPSMKVTYLSMPELDAKAAETPSEHVVGYFGSSLGGVGFAIPEASQGVSQLVSNMVGSEVLQRDAILHNVYDPWPLDNPIQSSDDANSGVIKSITPDLSLVYPVLQPITAKVLPLGGKPKKNKGRKSPNHVDKPASSKEKEEPDSPAVTALFLPWDRNDSAVKVSFIDDQHSSFGGPNEEHILVPLRDVASTPKPVRKGDHLVYEMTKWYKITKPQKQKVITTADSRNDLDLFAYDSASSIYLSATDRDTGNLSEDAGIRRQVAIVPVGAEVCVRVQLEVPSAAATTMPTQEQKESSFVLQTLLKGADKESSTISVLWNLTDNVKYVQNLMNSLLDQIESMKNILNWTSPTKTFPIYVALVAVWVVTVLVPGRLIILAIGLYEFFFVFLPIPEGRSSMIRFGNLIQSIPNDDDIAQIYSAEKKAFATAKQAEWRATEKSRKLELVLASPWRGRVCIKGSSSSSHHAGGLGDEWAEVYLMLQGRRLVWWVSEDALDQGKVAAGQLLLCGHSGLAQVSPMDIRKYGGDSKLVAVFGQDYIGRPQKLSIMLQDVESKAALFRLLDSMG